MNDPPESVIANGDRSAHASGLSGMLAILSRSEGAMFMLMLKECF
jgi:hypothetical protein